MQGARRIAIGIMIAKLAMATAGVYGYVVVTSVLGAREGGAVLGDGLYQVHVKASLCLRRVIGIASRHCDYHNTLLR